MNKSLSKDESNAFQLVKHGDNSFEFKKGKDAFNLVIKANEILSVILKLNYGMIFEGIFTYDELIQNKILRLCDNINEIYEMLFKKILEKSFSYDVNENKVDLSFEYNLENKNIPIVLKLLKVSDGDVSSAIQEVFKTNSKLEERIEYLEKKIEEMASNFQALEEKFKKVNYVNSNIIPKQYVLKWLDNQKKVFTSLENGSSIKVNYSSCWNDFHSTSFNSGVKEIILELDITSSSFYHAIGITNESFNGTYNCIGCQLSNDAWLLKQNGTIYAAGKSYASNVILPQNGNFILTIVVDCNNKLILFTDNNGNVSKRFSISGSEFKVSLGMCTSGACNYKFLMS